MIKKFSEIQNITIIGVGLIGGSIGLALKSNGFRGKIVGLGRRYETLNVALDRNAVDLVTTDFTEGLKLAELIIIGTPVSLIATIAENVVETIGKNRSFVMTDVGSVKSNIVYDIEIFLKKANANHAHFVGSHPMAGSEKTSVAAARADLFQNAKCLITPTENSEAHATEIIADLWKFVGGSIEILSPSEHDYLIGGASHFPHLIASILTKTTSQIDTPKRSALDFTATGFRDTTRIAAGSEEIWKDIFLQNTENLVPMINLMIENLEEIKRSLLDLDAEKIRETLAFAKAIRENLETR